MQYTTHTHTSLPSPPTPTTYPRCDGFQYTSHTHTQEAGHALPGRTTIVVSRTVRYVKNQASPSVCVCRPPVESTPTKMRVGWSLGWA